MEVAHLIGFEGKAGRHRFISPLVLVLELHRCITKMVN